MQIIFEYNWYTLLISQDRAFGEIPVDNTVRDKLEDGFFFLKNPVWIPCFYLLFFSLSK
jgi:hypothetical protein